MSWSILWYRLKDLVHEYIAKPDGNVGMSVVRGAFLGSRTNLSSEVYCDRLVNKRSGGPGKCFRPAECGVYNDRPRVPSESKPQFLAAAMYPTTSNTLYQNSISHSKDVCGVLEPLRLFTDQTPKKECVTISLPLPLGRRGSGLTASPRRRCSNQHVSGVRTRIGCTSALAAANRTI